MEMTAAQIWTPIRTESGEKTPFELHRDRSNGTCELYDKRCDLCYPEIPSHDMRYRCLEEVWGNGRYYLPVAPKMDKHDYSRTPDTERGIFCDTVKEMQF